MLEITHAPHDTVLKRYRVAAGSARTIHDYLRPQRLPSLPRFFHPSRLFSIARSLLHPRFRYGNRYRNRARRPLTQPTQINAPAAPNSTHRHSTHHSSGTQLKSPPPVKSPVKIFDARTRTQDFPCHNKHYCRCQPGASADNRDPGWRTGPRR